MSQSYLMTAHVRHQAVFSRIFNRHRFENNELEWLFRRYILRVSMTTSYMSFSSLSAFVLLKPFSSYKTSICVIAHHLILKYTKLLVIITPILEKTFTQSMISHPLRPGSTCFHPPSCCTLRHTHRFPRHCQLHEGTKWTK